MASVHPDIIHVGRTQIPHGNLLVRHSEPTVLHIPTPAAKPQPRRPITTTTTTTATTTATTTTTNNTNNNECDVVEVSTQASLVGEVRSLELEEVLLASVRGEDVQVVDGQSEPVVRPGGQSPHAVLHVLVRGWEVPGGDFP